MGVRAIQMEWITQTLYEPEMIMDDPQDPDCRHFLKRIRQRNNRALRVVVNTKAAPNRIVTVFFDRRLKAIL